ncbi:MAG: hypothetical protein CMP61_00650 [Flavobacteriales bacterium]|nr:hypothetical protein [Flavobacteriales bacterium]|tara:strand:+ start:20737 stop:21105 length:369 start_codon:yes stop_codon:yes gene_type:complete
MNRKGLNILIALVWLINGLFCKVLNFVPRHKEIVSEILGKKYADLFTIMIGVAEIGMFIWIISGMAKKFNAWFQITLILIMNCIEFVLVPDLLLWGRFNIVFGALFCYVIYLINNRKEVSYG